MASAAGETPSDQHEEALVADVLEAISLEGDDLSGMLRATARALVQHVGATSAGIWLLDADAQVLVRDATAGVEPHLAGPEDGVPFGALPIGRVADTRLPLVVDDVTDTAGGPAVVEEAFAGRDGRVAFAGYPLLARGRLVGVLGLVLPAPLSPARAEGLRRVADAIAVQAERNRAQQRMHLEHVVLRQLQRVSAALLDAQFDLEEVVQVVTDAATEASGAQFGAFFYNVVSQDGESYVLYTLSGAPRSAFERFGLPRNTPVFDPTFRGEGIIRLDDVTADARYGTMAPHHGMPPGHLPVRAYLAVPVRARDGEVLGGLFFGHETPGTFTELSEMVVTTIAHHAAMAIENARLYGREHGVATTLQHGLLPERLPKVPGVTLAADYRPAAEGHQVGGDWYDALVLGDGRVGICVGDVCGHDIRAAATMGQLRAAMRAYQVEVADPAAVVERLDRFATIAGIGTFTTLVYGVYDPADRTLTFLRAGHPPPVLVTAERTCRVLDSPAVPPVGGELIRPGDLAGAVTRVTLPPGSTVLLYTDGLIEHRSSTIRQGLARLVDAASRAEPGDPDRMCQHVLRELAGEGRDDIVVLAMTA